jgi:cell wall-associated NlpC family hydrolase
MRVRANVTVLCLALVALLALQAAAASAAVPRATLLPSGRAVAPPSAPPSVKAMIEAANRIHSRPYRWGGGHRDWNSRGYDCSGSVSYVMHAAGLLESPLDSTGFMRWGAGGAGSWVRVYANREHVFAVIAGLRWDTSFSEDGDRSGPGWSEQMRPGGGFRLRHPLGLEAATPLARGALSG